MQNLTLGIIGENIFTQPRFTEHVLYAEHRTGSCWTWKCKRQCLHSHKVQRLFGKGLCIRGPDLCIKHIHSLNLDIAGLEFCLIRTEFQKSTYTMMLKS